MSNKTGTPEAKKEAILAWVRKANPELMVPKEGQYIQNQDGKKELIVRAFDGRMTTLDSFGNGTIEDIERHGGKFLGSPATMHYLMKACGCNGKDGITFKDQQYKSLCIIANWKGDKPDNLEVQLDASPELVDFLFPFTQS